MSLHVLQPIILLSESAEPRWNDELLNSYSEAHTRWINRYSSLLLIHQQENLLIAPDAGFFYLTPEDMVDSDEVRYNHVWMTFAQNPAVKAYVARELDMDRDVLLWFRESDGVNMAYLL
jgi:hypothetical protein